MPEVHQKAEIGNTSKVIISPRYNLWEVIRDFVLIADFRCNFNVYLVYHFLTVECQELIWRLKFYKKRLNTQNQSADANSFFHWKKLKFLKRTKVQLVPTNELGMYCMDTESILHALFKYTILGVYYFSGTIDCVKRHICIIYRLRIIVRPEEVPSAW